MLTGETDREEGEWGVKAEAGVLGSRVNWRVGFFCQ